MGKMIVTLLGSLLAQTLSAYNFPYERVQLTDFDVGSDSDMAFGSPPDAELAHCKTYPGYEGWPSSDRWAAFNVSLGGVLLKGIPPAAACYEGEYKDVAGCANVRRRQNDALFA